MSSIDTLFVTKIYRAELTAPRHGAERGDWRPPACPSRRTTKPGSAGARRTAIRATRPTRPSTICPGGCRYSGELLKVLDKHVAAFAKELRIRPPGPQARARQPVDQHPASRRRPHLPHPPAFGGERHLLRDDPGRRERAEIRGSAPRLHDGGPAAQGQGQAGEPAIRLYDARARAQCCCGRAGCATRCPSTRPKASASASASITPGADRDHRPRGRSCGRKNVKRPMAGRNEQIL